MVSARRCGIENCRSRTFKVIDGQTVCSRGHVHVHDLQLEQDEQAVFAAPFGSSRKRLKRDLGKVLESSHQKKYRQFLNYLLALQYLLHKLAVGLCNSIFEDQTSSKITCSIGTLECKCVHSKISQNYVQAVANCWIVWLFINPLLKINDRKTKRNKPLDFLSQYVETSSDDESETDTNEDSSNRAELPPRILYSRRPGSMQSNALTKLNAVGTRFYTVEIDQNLEENQKILTLDTILSWHTQASYLLVFLYFGLLLSGSPYSLSDLYKWITTRVINFERIGGLLSSSMRKNLHRNDLALLADSRNPSFDELNSVSHGIALLFKHKANFIIPSLNSQVMILRLAANLSIPSQVVSDCIEIWKDTSFTFNLYETSSKLKKYIAPEIVLAATVLFVLMSRLESYSIDIKGCEKLLIDPPFYTAINFENLTEKDILQLDSKDINDYVDWVFRNYGLLEEQINFPKKILDLFPVKNNKIETKAQKSLEVHSTRELKKKIGENIACYFGCCLDTLESALQILKLDLP